MVFAFRLAGDLDGDAETGSLCVACLERDRTYAVVDCTPGTPDEALDTRTGAVLAATGLPWPRGSPPVAAVWELSLSDPA